MDWFDRFINKLADTAGKIVGTVAGVGVVVWFVFETGVFDWREIATHLGMLVADFTQGYTKNVP